MRRWLTLCTLLIFSLVSPMAWLSGAAQQEQGDPEAEASAAAIELSRFEASGDFGGLVALLHPDAEAVMPPGVVVDWYTEVFAQRDAGEITNVTSVELIEWTWPVNGKTYQDTAEITFEQPLGGEAETDTVHLVEVSGVWRWFFGVSLEDANAKLDTYAPDYPAAAGDPATAVITDDGSIPWGLADATTADLTTDGVAAALPEDIAGNTLRAEPEVAEPDAGLYLFATSSTTYTYEAADDPASTVAGFNISELPSDLSVAQALEEIRSSETFPIPLDDFLRVNLNMETADEGGVPFLLYRQSAGEDVGDVPYLVWGAADGTALYTATAQDLSLVRLVGEGLADNLQGEDFA